MYISGAPGCGKTALLRELHLHFQTYEQENVSDFCCSKDFFDSMFLVGGFENL